MGHRPSLPISTVFSPLLSSALLPRRRPFPSSLSCPLLFASFASSPACPGQHTWQKLGVNDSGISFKKDALGVGRVLGFILLSQSWVLEDVHFPYHANPFCTFLTFFAFSFFPCAAFGFFLWSDSESDSDEEDSSKQLNSRSIDSSASSSSVSSTRVKYCLISWKSNTDYDLF